jgi:hypothetical protein
MSDTNLATVPIRELITSFRKQIDELPREALFNTLFLTTITNRFESMADEIDALKSDLAKHQESEFHPDWSLLEASRESLREHMALLKTAQARITELSRLGEHE